MTPSEAEAKRQKAVEFLQRIGQEQDAERFEAMDAAAYAEHRGAELRENSIRRYRNMPRKNTRDLQAELDDANDYIADLEDKLDSIAGIASGDEDEDDDSDDDDRD
jgi:hypothetical protein